MTRKICLYLCVLLLGSQAARADEDPTRWGSWAEPGFSVQLLAGRTADTGAGLAMDQRADSGPAALLPTIGPAEAAQFDPVSEISGLPDAVVDSLLAPGGASLLGTLCGLLSLSGC